MDALAELITAPVQPWDAVICTSEAVKNNVTQVLQAQADYLQDRLGITKLQLPQLPVIPLGIHTQEFEFTDEQKSLAREKLGITNEEFVVLYMGRLSFHAKAHPLALYQSLEAASHKTQKKIVLVECGWFANNHIEQAFSDAATIACPSVRIIKLDGRNSENRAMSWASADAFSSLVDNIQETFGITPVEAMAAGLPVIVSDWNGYKDTVRNGIDGFRVPTIMPQAGLGGDLALRHALDIDNYDIYCGYTCSFIAVDIEVATQSFVQLISSPTLCKQMGYNGKVRSREIFDWSKIIPRYEALWSELDQIRKTLSKDLKPIQNIWPARLDPFRSFSSYPSHQLTIDDSVEIISSNNIEIMEKISNFKMLRMINFASKMLPTDDETYRIVEACCGKQILISDLLLIFPGERQPFIMRGLLWLIKIGVMRKTN
jgi:glycosyltransferase involved in cell wall biosynthesis